MEYLYWKLQSINQSDELEIGSKEFNLYRDKYKKDFDTKELMSEQETVEHYKLNAYKNPIFSKIYSLTLAFVENNNVRVKYIRGEEKDLITTFLNTIKSDYFKDFKLVHLDAEYMLPYLGIRMDRNGIRSSITDLSYKNARPWNLTGVCLRSYYQGAGNYRPNLKEMAYIYNIDTNFIDFADEFDYFRANKLEELKGSAIVELFTTVNVHRLIMGENLIEDLTVSEEYVEKVEELKPRGTTLLEDLINAENITTSSKEELKSILKKKKLTKKDRVIVEDILTNLYVNNKMFNVDSAEIKERKRQEIKQLLDEVK